MNPTQQQSWKREALDMAFEALAASSDLSDKLVYNGARILALRLGGDQRASYDLDANILLSFAKSHPSRDEQAALLACLIEKAISAYSEDQDIVRYELVNVKIVHTPRKDHPMGWNAFDVTVQLRDHRNEGVRGLPNINFDIAAPECLGADAIAPLEVGGEIVFAYTLERIAGEKMRAFLSSLGAYRRKVKKPGHVVRAKDLYDVSVILTAKPLYNVEFWTSAGEEFQLACASRYVDCAGIDTFAEDFDVTRATYESDATLPKLVDFESAWNATEEIVGFWETVGIFPLAYQLPHSEYDSIEKP